MVATDTTGPPSSPPETKSVKPGNEACTSLRAAFLFVEAEALPKNVGEAQQALLRIKDFRPAAVAYADKVAASLLEESDDADDCELSERRKNKPSRNFSMHPRIGVAEASLDWWELLFRRWFSPSQNQP